MFSFFLDNYKYVRIKLKVYVTFPGHLFLVSVCLSAYVPLGPHIWDLHILCVILASFFSNIQTILPTQLNLVVDYVFQWQLKNNPLKSFIIYFTSKHNRWNSASENIFLFKNKNLPIESIYAELTISNKLLKRVLQKKKKK